MTERFDRGALTEAVFYILLSLHVPMHGYGIMQNIEKLTAGRVVLGPGTLYGAINALVQKKWIKAHSPVRGDRKKEYIITPAGKSAFSGEMKRLRELLTNGESIETEERK